MKKNILILGLALMTLGVSLNANAMGCTAEAQCSPTVKRSCTGEEECEALVCLFIKCDGEETTLEDCPNCQPPVE